MVLTLKSCEGKEAALQYAIDHWVECAHCAIKERGRFNVALSGGSTPKAIYQQLPGRDLDWERIFLFWSDERSVPPDHPDSNYQMAMSANLPVPEENIFRMHAETDIEVNAAAYEQVIKTETGGVFDLCMLGMGDDGHTASLFPETEALNETERLVVPNFVPKFDSWRMTMTFPCINASRAIAIYVLGAAKEERLRSVLAGTPYPISHVGTEAIPALLITDIASLSARTG